MEKLREALKGVFIGQENDIKTLQDELANTHSEVGNVNHQKKELLDKYKKIEEELNELKLKAKNDGIYLVEKERQIILMLSTQSDLNDRLAEVASTLGAVLTEDRLGRHTFTQAN